jgi:hypothetical protein
LIFDLGPLTFGNCARRKSDFQRVEDYFCVWAGVSSRSVVLFSLSSTSDTVPFTFEPFLWLPGAFATVKGFDFDNPLTGGSAKAI